MMVGSSDSELFALHQVEPALRVGNILRVFDRVDLFEGMLKALKCVIREDILAGEQ